MTWNTFFINRKRLKYTRLAVGTVVGLGSLAGALNYALFQAKYDPSATVFGIDPAFIYLASCVGVGFGGYLCGTFMGGPVWRMFKRLGGKDSLRAFYDKEADFLLRIKKNRSSDLSSVGVNDDIRRLDYYGERITSVAKYRSWLKIQKDFIKTGRLPIRLTGA